MNNSTTNSPNAPAAAEACYREGDRLHDLRDFDAALAQLDAALRADPDHWLARYTRAVLLQDLGRHADAVAEYQAVLAAQPQHPKAAKAWHNLGVACHHSGDLARAENAYRAVLAIDPGHLLAAKSLAGLRADQGDAEGAHALLRPFLNAQSPSAIDLYDALILPAIAQSDEEIFAARAALLAKLTALADHPPLLTDPLREVGRTPLFQLTHGFDDRDLLALLGSVYRRASPPLCYVAPHVPAYAGPGAKIRVGFVSGFFSEHSVGRAMAGLIERLPRERFEVVVCFLGRRAADGIATRIATAATQAVDVPYAVFEAQHTIAALELDLLFFADIGLEPLSHLLALGRLAPAQCTSWGQPETSGSNTIDDYVSVAGWEADVEPETRYSERLVLFHEVATPSWIERPALSGGSSQLATDAPSFFCPHSALKLHPDFDDLLADILVDCPHGRVYLIEPSNAGWAARLRTRLQSALAARGADLAARLVWLPQLGHADYMASLAAADVVLDTPYFGGGPTLLDAIACATPFVTLAGETQRARIGAGLLEFLGLAEYVARSSRDYVQRAVRLATEPTVRAAFSDALRRRSNRVFEDETVIVRWSDYFTARVQEAQRRPGPRPSADRV